MFITVGFWRIYDKNQIIWNCFKKNLCSFLLGYFSNSKMLINVFCTISEAFSKRPDQQPLCAVMLTKVWFHSLPHSNLFNIKKQTNLCFSFETTHCFSGFECVITAHKCNEFELLTHKLQMWTQPWRLWQEENLWIICFTFLHGDFHSILKDPKPVVAYRAGARLSAQSSSRGPSGKVILKFTTDIFITKLIYPMLPNP